METHNWITIFLASMRLGDTPVPIPNTTVKTQEADGTALETVWESRWMPDLRGCSSVGRAPALQAGGREFESLRLHPERKLLIKKFSGQQRFKKVVFVQF